MRLPFSLPFKVQEKAITYLGIKISSNLVALYHENYITITD